MLAALGLLTAELNISLHFDGLYFAIFLWVSEPYAWKQATFFVMSYVTLILSFVQCVFFFSTIVGGQQVYCKLWGQYISVLTCYNCSKWVHEIELG